MKDNLKLIQETQETSILTWKSCADTVRGRPLMIGWGPEENSEMSLFFPCEGLFEFFFSSEGPFQFFFLGKAFLKFFFSLVALKFFFLINPTKNVLNFFFLRAKKISGEGPSKFIFSWRRAPEIFFSRFPRPPQIINGHPQW